MINKYPLWKYVLLAIVLIAGILFALPNLYGDHPAVQISPRTGDIPPELQSQVAETLKAGGIEEVDFRTDGNRLLALFADGETQATGHGLIDVAHSGRNTTALNLVPATPAWLRKFAEPMSLGLDLRGGVHFLMEVDTASAINSAEEKYVDEFRTVLLSLIHI